MIDFLFLNFLKDIDFIIKLAFIIFLITFVKQRITKNWLAITAIVIASVVLIFFYWPIIGFAYVVYVLIVIGIGGVLVDAFFVTMGEAKQGKGADAPDPRAMLGDFDEDVDYEEIAAQRKVAMKRFGGKPGRGPGR